ncbi:diguanylate cyclase [Candidatus Omnitrophota bacterium]
MLKFAKKLSVSSSGLKTKLLISFALMSVIPILVLAYVVSIYIFPALDVLSKYHVFTQQDLLHSISLIVLLVVLTSLLGFYVAKITTDRIINASIEARMIASGRFNKKIPLDKKGERDEIGDIVDSVNKMASLMRADLEEFKVYSQRTQEINVSMRKNLLALSGLLQVADVISSGSVDSKDVVELILEKVSQLVDSSYSALFLKDEGTDVYSLAASFNVEGELIRDRSVRMNEGLLGKALFSRTVLVIDDAPASRESEEFRRKNNVKNLVAVPIYTRRKSTGILLVGNRQKDFTYQKDELEFYRVFAKQVILVTENDLLLKKVKELAMKDDLTGLFTENYIKGALEDEIRRAIFFQRPCSFDLFNLDGFKIFREKFGDLKAEEVLKKVAAMIKKKAGPVGKAARVGGDGFALLLPEKNKREAARIADEFRREVESANFAGDRDTVLTVSGGVGENPLDGSSGEEIFGQAMRLLKKAKSEGKNKVLS